MQIWVMIIVAWVARGRSFNNALVAVRVLLHVVITTLSAHSQVNDLNRSVVDKDVYVDHRVAHLQKVIR